MTLTGCSLDPVSGAAPLRVTMRVPRAPHGVLTNSSAPQDFFKDFNEVFLDSGAQAVLLQVDWFNPGTMDFSLANKVPGGFGYSVAAEGTVKVTVVGAGEKVPSAPVGLGSFDTRIDINTVTFTRMLLTSSPGSGFLTFAVDASIGPIVAHMGETVELPITSLTNGLIEPFGFGYKVDYWQLTVDRGTLSPPWTATHPMLEFGLVDGPQPTASGMWQPGKAFGAGEGFTFSGFVDEFRRTNFFNTFGGGISTSFQPLPPYVRNPIFYWDVTFSDDTTYFPSMVYEPSGAGIIYPGQVLSRKTVRYHFVPPVIAGHAPSPTDQTNFVVGSIDGTIPPAGAHWEITRFLPTVEYTAPRLVGPIYIDWGDGSPLDGSIAFDVEHVLDAPGDYVVTAESPLGRDTFHVKVLGGAGGAGPRVEPASLRTAPGAGSTVVYREAGVL